MTGTVFAVASGKGGVGKTTTAINLGAMLAAADHGVVVVDTDLGMANVGGYLDFEMDGATLHEVLSDDATVEEAIYHAPGDIDVLPSSTDIYTFAQSQTAQLQRVVAELREEYEYVLLDTGAGISYDTILPLSLADDVLLVTTPDVASVRDTAKTAELTSRVEGTVRGAVLTQRGNDILNADNVEGTLDTDVLTVVPDDETVPMGIDAGRPLALFSPNSPAATAYRELSNILSGETDTPELSGEPDTSASNVPSLSDAEFELGTPEESPGFDPSPESEPAEHENADPDPTASHSAATASDSETESSPFDSPLDSESAPEVEQEPESESETEPESETSSSEISDSASDPVHELIDRKVVKTGDDADGSVPSAEPAPLETEVASEEVVDDADGPPLDADIPTDDADAPEPTADTATPSDESVTERDDADEFDTVLSDQTDRHAESASEETADSSADLPDEIVEAEPDDEEGNDVEAVPFQDETVRPGLGSDENDGDGDDGEEKNGLFGRIGSLFR
ncbi:AAA family ATPase [Haladaptatus sp. DYF46]|uniref:AAA family ATPase n=1 Tax=Haladaptatus sp. DYF46 TaxID=2886041 RepID=UPI001E29CCBC|nr:AAA family ATPase [Haladaptatus sp. DYF46]